MKIHRNVRLRVEELESRLVPSAGTPWPYPTSNWSGYSVDAAAYKVTDVKGSWTVPAVTGNSAAYSATWVGIDGDNSSTVEQIGTDSEMVKLPNGTYQAHYDAWYEMYPAYPVYLSMAIHPGDQMFAEVSYVGSATSSSGSFVLTISNLTTSETFSTTQKLTSAETVFGGMDHGGALIGRKSSPLANFGSETFSGAYATIGGTTGTISAFFQGTTTVVYNIDIAILNKKTHTYTYYDVTGPLNSTGDSFTVYTAQRCQGRRQRVGDAWPMDRLNDFQLVATVAATASRGMVVEISPATPSNANSAIPLIANGPPAREAFPSLPEGALGRSGLVSDGTAVGPGHLGAGLLWIGFSPVSAMAIPVSVTVAHGNTMVHGARSESHAEPFATAWSPIEQPAMGPAPALMFSEDSHMDQVVGALAVVAFLPSLHMPKTNQGPARTRRLPIENALPE